ncbi:hypothetical protein KJ365_10135 [Glaciecola sp. XM2]|jgi:hypothetical protein|uniref:hypothetical protein n=1 Tax=Glaciecola sp. XM2 TaxID=1914931 RepID=UPI001BDEE003|nr:hypothetical protein [Glaciecola sp. XM2]MBT1451233.1 hypothetical protein [Glaciecola sp. XM2]
MPKSPVKSLLERHDKLIHSEQMTVASHVQREDEDWWLNTLMIKGFDVPFKYKRKKRYQSLKGAQVNLTYYPCDEEIAGLSFDYMKVVRVKRS